jgi:hypothetical protein
MTAPNTLNVSNVTLKTAFATLTTATANVITNSASSNTAVKLNNLVLTNYSASPVTANVVVNRSATTYYLAGSLAIPANSTLVLLGKDTALYLEEGDVVQANSSANTAVSFAGSYEIIA